MLIVKKTKQVSEAVNVVYIVPDIRTISTIFLHPERHKILINRIPLKTNLSSKWPVRRFKLKDERDSVRLYGPAWVFIKGLQAVAHSPFVSYCAFVINFSLSVTTTIST